jgi:hypothetical protein
VPWRLVLADNDMERDRLRAHHDPIGKCGFAAAS